MTSTTDISDRLAEWRHRHEHSLERMLPAEDREPVRLHRAMRYAVLAGGKRIRPLLVYAAAQALGVCAARVDGLACAVELIHAYSLIHDDLPAMDDDTLRRGRPTCHLAFDEATAILAGDALQALAFDSIVHGGGEASSALVRALARACGSTGMAGGQMLDLTVTGRPVTIEELEEIHRLKTGALITLAVVAPALLAKTPDTVRSALERYGQCVGLGFQIRDDILDVTGETAVTGKTAQADAARNQPTFPSLIGLPASRARAEALSAEALECLTHLDGDTSTLAWLAEYMIRRDR